MSDPDSEKTRIAAATHVLDFDTVQHIATDSLYETDFAQWLSEQTTLLRTQQFDELDVEHLVEELDGLAGRDRRERKNRLETIFEHMLKRDMYSNDDAVRGWNETIRHSAREIANLLEDSPSLLQVLTAQLG